MAFLKSIPKPAAAALVDSTIKGEIHMNLYYIPLEEVTATAHIFLDAKTDITNPANTTTTFTKDYIFDKDVTMFQLFSHAHQTNTEFRAEIIGGTRDQEQIYYSNDWLHPPILEYTDLHINADEGIRSIATFKNETDSPIGFGLRSYEEMMIMFGLYYER